MFYTSEGLRLFATTEGAGPDVVLLHPTPLSHEFWRPLVLELKGRYRMTVPDLRGHGQSEPGQGAISMDRLGGDVERLLDAARIPRATFAGCSIGSYVLYELWRRIPSRINALAFCCGKPQPDAPANRAKRLQNIETIMADGTAGFFDQMVDTLIGSAFRSREPEKVAAVRGMMNSMGPEAVIAVQQGLMDRPDSVPTVRTISVPVLALAGGEDRASTPEEMRAIPELLPGTEYHLLSEAGHFAPYEQPDTVSQILGDFFDRVSGI